MIPIIDGYSTGDYTFPSRDIPDTQKGEKYCLQNAQSVYALFLANQCSWGTADITRFSDNRAYSNGTQNVNRYKSWLLQDSDDGSSTTPVSVESFDDLPLSRQAKRLGWSNIMWRNLSPAPSIMSALHGQFDKADFDLYVNTIDADSRGLMENEKYRKMVEAKFADWQIEFKKKAGIPVDEQMIYPRTQEEFDMFEAEDGFKLAVAISMQKLLRYSFEISEWDTTVRKKVIDDLISIGYGAVRDYFNVESNKWEVMYLDPAFLIIQYSNEFDYKDAEYAGYVRYWTISNLRNKLPNVPEEQLRQLAQNNLNKYGNPVDTGRWDSHYSKLDPNSNTYRYDSFKVPVLEAEWMDYVSKRTLHYKNRYGRNLIIELGSESEVRPISEESKKLGATQELKKYGIRQPYQCFWVIGTEHVFDYGKVKMASRESLNKPALSFHVEQLLQPPIIENLIPILDEITQLYLRYQNSLAMLVEKGYALNTAMLNSINYGSSTMPIPEIVKMWRQTGILLYSYGQTGLYTGGAALPVTPIDGGLGTRVDETIKSLEFAFRKIELFAGVNLLSIGITPEPNVPTSTTKEAMQSTLNVLKPILDATLEVKKSAGESLMRRIQVGIRNSEQIRNTYKGVISPSEIDALKLMEGNGVQYGLILKPKPDSVIKAQFYKWIEVALQDTRDGNTGLYTSDGIYFTTRLEGGEDIMDLMRQMRYTIKKNREEKSQQDAQAQQQNIEGQMAVQQQKHQQEMEKLQAEGQQSVGEELVRGKIKENQMRQEMVRDVYAQLREAADAESGINTSIRR